MMKTYFNYRRSGACGFVASFLSSIFLSKSVIVFIWPLFVWTYGEIVLENIRAEFKERGLDPALAPVLVQAEKPPFLEEGEFGHKTTLQKKGNTVYLTVYMEAQCPDTTGFIRRQLLPAWSRLGATNRVNVSIVPFGKARCAQTEAEEGEDYRCECQHGQNECELNQLMNCAIEFLPDADSYVPLIGCVQGKESVSTAFKSCLAGHSSSDRLWECAMGRRGRHLHARAGNRTAAIGNAFNFVPWVVLDGKRDNDAFYALEENLCKRLNEPKPIQCIKFS